MIPQEDDAVGKFLRRQPGDQSFLLRILHHLGRIASAYPDTFQSRHIAVEKALGAIIELREIASGREAFKVYDYQDFFERYLRHLKNHL